MNNVENDLKEIILDYLFARKRGYENIMLVNI